MKNLGQFGFLLIICSLIFLSCKGHTQEEVKTSFSINNLFSDHMVLQQQESVAIWGTAMPDQQISVAGSWGEQATNTADAMGNWQVRLNTPVAGGPYEVTVSNEEKSIVLKDVLIGEVWLASGQSNMEMPLEGFLPNEPIDNYQEEIALAYYPKIRFFDVARAIESMPTKNFVGKWTPTEPETASQISATGFFFARKLHQELDVPIGIITSNWGGTPVESWMSKEKILDLNEFGDELESLKEENIAVYNEWFSQFPKSKVPSSSEAWSNLNLDDDAFALANFDDSNWKKTPELVAVEDLPVISSDGVYWFRKKIIIDDISSDYTLEIAKGIDDMDQTFVNGKKIGSTFGWNVPRLYTIPKSILVQGENSIAVRVVDTGGGGGFMSEPSLTNKATEKQIPISEDWSFNQSAGFQGSNFLLFHKNEQALRNPPEGIDSYKMDANTPTVLYNGMIHPLIPYNIKGAIWYQGESNVGRDQQYLKLFPGMIEDWRERWQYDFSFYFVQIAPFDYGNGLSPALREAQRKSLKTPKTGMAITMDIGMEKSIHPGNKQDVGKRLAQLALANDYEKNLMASGPIYKSHSISGNKLIVQFDFAENGLTTLKSDLSGFEIAGDDKTFIPADAKIVNNTIEVSSSKIAEPQHVRYAWKDFIVGSLYNNERLSASSFSTED